MWVVHFFDPRYILWRPYRKDPKRDPNLENYPCEPVKASVSVVKSRVVLECRIWPKPSTSDRTRPEAIRPTKIFCYDMNFPLG